MVHRSRPGAPPGAPPGALARLRTGPRAGALALLAAGSLAAACASTGGASGGHASPEAAAQALVDALRPYDADKVRAVLGPEAEELLSSGDEVADSAEIEAFLSAYDDRHALLTSGDEAVLVVGDDWPLPIPLVRSGDSWRFNVVRGKEEIVARRIGRNELATIEVCRAIVDAQREFAALDPHPGEYAARFVSAAGKRDGLYWPAAEGEPESPLGPLVAEAAAEGYSAGSGGERQPYHGYYYRLLTAQGPSAPGGALDYVVDGRMTGGFAVIAEPAAYGSSGVMTFLVGPAGIVYERDLGPETSRLAAEIQRFDPDRSWKLARD